MSVCMYVCMYVVSYMGSSGMIDPVRFKAFASIL